MKVVASASARRVLDVQLSVMSICPLQSELSQK